MTFDETFGVDLPTACEQGFCDEPSVDWVWSEELGRYLGACELHLRPVHDHR